MRSDGSNQERITTTQGSYLAWSPDRSKIAFAYQDDIWVMNPDGTGQHPLTADNDTRDYGPAWSPDGSRIAYWGRVGIGAGDIYVMNSSGTNQKPLTDAVIPTPVPHRRPMAKPSPSTATAVTATTKSSS